MARPFLSRAFTTWHARTAHPTSRVQVYTSASHDPFLNLAAEHYLLQHSHPESTVLFLYVNDPCVVIGRNQNPWVEANLALLRQHALPPVRLVRRRSGGGTVFHDLGNVNYSVLMAPARFDRNTHAEMVTRALHRLSPSSRSARVNERHDIVLDGDPTPFKVSGSAYKLTRLRALHHGTCLLASPHLSLLSQLLRSPAVPWISARGVESVRSPVRNVGGDVDGFVAAVRGEFVGMYGAPDVEGMVPADAVDGEEGGIQSGYRELTSLDWIYNQTPLFTFSTHPSDDDPRPRPPLPPGVPHDFRATLTARHGQIQHADMAGLDGAALHGRHLHTITDWREVLRPVPGGACTATAADVGDWFNHLFGVGLSETQG